MNILVIISFLIKLYRILIFVILIHYAIQLFSINTLHIHEPQTVKILYNFLNVHLLQIYSNLPNANFVHCNFAIIPLYHYYYITIFHILKSTI